MLPAVNFKIVNHLNPKLAETETPISGIALCPVYKRSIHLCVCILWYSQKLPDLPVRVTLTCYSTCWLSLLLIYRNPLCLLVILLTTIVQIQQLDLWFSALQSIDVVYFLLSCPLVSNILQKADWKSSPQKSFLTEKDWKNLCFVLTQGKRLKALVYLWCYRVKALFMTFVFLQGGSWISTLAPDTQKGREGIKNHAQHCKTQWQISLTTLLRGTVICLS